MKLKLHVLAASLLTSQIGSLAAQEQFSKIVGAIAVEPVAAQTTLGVPFITGGGDVATLYANGGLETHANSIYAKHGLKIKLTPGDDFVGQVRDYMSGKSPLLRGTFRMLGQASEVIASDPRTKPVVVLQLSWSGGDQIVARENLKTLNDLKRDGQKVRVACQQGGPHVGLLYDALAAAALTKDDIEIVFVADITGAHGAAEAFRNDPTIDACCVITPDMLELTGGLDSIGTGAEGTVLNAHVLVSTQNMSRSIADVYAVRSDWFQANRSTVEKFVAGYLKAAEEVVTMRDDAEKTRRMSLEYCELLGMSQQIFGRKILPTLEVDAHRLLLDCRFVGLLGQITFFEQKGNLNGFDRKLASALHLATTWGYAKTRNGFDPAGFNYPRLAVAAGVKYVQPNIRTIDVFLHDDWDTTTIVKFQISFEPNQTNFSVERYEAEFNRALQAASTFGGATVLIRGHADPTKALVNVIRSGMKKGLITRIGQTGNYSYFLNTAEGRQELDLQDTKAIVELIRSGAFEGTPDSPLQTIAATLNLSLRRAEEVAAAIVAYAQSRDINVDVWQLVPVGAGIDEPVFPKPTSMEEAMQNMRVEFLIVRVKPPARSRQSPLQQACPATVTAPTTSAPSRRCLWRRQKARKFVPACKLGKRR